MASLKVEGVIGRLHYADQLIKFTRDWGGACPQQAAENLAHAHRVLKESIEVLKES